MIETKIWTAFARRHKFPLIALTLLPIFVNALALSGLFNTDPTLQFIGLGEDVRGGWISGAMGWLDPSVAYITQPVGHLGAADWLHGIIPWWNPYAGVGMPLAAEVQTSAFFLPFSLLLYFNCGWLLLVVLLQIGCGVFTYALLTEIDLTRAAAFLGGALFALSPEFFLCPSAPIGPLPFLPLLLLGIERSATAANRDARMGWSLVTVACAYSVYAGNPEVGYFDGLLAGFWALWRLGGLPAAARLRFVAKLCLGGVIALTLCAPLLIPFLDYLRVANSGGHTSGLFSTIRLNPTGMPLQILPFLYGKFGSSPPPALFAAFGGGYVRVPAWVDIPVLALALSALWRRGKLPNLRIVLLLWIVVWEARYAGVSQVTWLMNQLPGLATADSTRYSGAALDFAIITLAALGFDDYCRLPALSAARLSAILLTLGLILAAVVVPISDFIRAWYAAKPHDMFVSFGTTAFAIVILALLSAELRRPRYRRALVGILLLGPALTLVFPQFAGFRSEHLDMAPIRYLQSHIGTSRMLSLGPIDLNFPDRWRIASINYSALPAPELWTSYLTTQLFPEADKNDYGGGWPNQRLALGNNLAAYEAIGVRYVVANPGESFPAAYQLPVVNMPANNSARTLMPGGPDITGTIATNLPFRSVAAVSALVGTYAGQSRGPVTGTFCAAGACATAAVQAGIVPDNSPMLFLFAKPLDIPAGATVTYDFGHPSGIQIALWFGATASGGAAPSLDFINVVSPLTPPKLVFQDAKTAIYELPQSAPYAQTANADCRVNILDRQDIETSCPKPTLLTRRELFFPGWSATVNGHPARISQTGLFQSVPVPSGPADTRFSYAPPHIRAASDAALIALAFWLGLAFWRWPGRNEPQH
ncbi:MAG TPA: hypothetical protein PLY97_02635 [Acidocella sp.]|nr:hypothetical protein [Acidocella sp.]